VFWDVFGGKGHPIRATVSEMGPLLLSRILNLNEIQAGVLNLVFKVADDNGLLLLDLKALRSMAQFVGDNAETFTAKYGNVSKASVGAIQRNLLALQEQGAESLFSEPALDFDDLMQADAKGQGTINILVADADAVSRCTRRSCSGCSELFGGFPGGGPAKLRSWSSFDERTSSSRTRQALEDKISRSCASSAPKVGVYFVTQNPLDLPTPSWDSSGTASACARAFTPGPESRQGGCRDVPRQSETQHRQSDHGAWRRRSAGFHARREGRADGRRAGLGHAAAKQPESALARRDEERRPGVHPVRHVRKDGRPGVGLREAQGAGGASPSVGRDRPSAGQAATAVPDGGAYRRAGQERGPRLGSQVGRQIIRGVLGSSWRRRR
jgi:hypothetical protein